MNVLYIHTHDSGRVLSPYGYAAPTPRIAAFARDATMFRQAYCAAPTCSPSRAALLTGTYPHQNGMLGLAQRGFVLDMKRHLVPYLNGHGYHTVLCGIQHESGWYLDRESGAASIGYREELTADNARFEQEELTLWDQENAARLANWIAAREAKQPFFISYGMYATHRRYPKEIGAGIDADYVLPPAPMPDAPETRADHARYMTSVQSADRCFGTVMDALKRRGLYEKTIVLFTTDHGLANPFSKCTLFDSGIGVALVMRVPGSPGRGRVVENLVSQIDVFPTLCELLQLPAPAYLEGQSFAASFTDVDAPTREAVFGEVNFHTSYEPMRCVRTKRYKYIRYYDEAYLKTNLSNIDESESKAYFVERGLARREKYREALYDLAYDTGERNNLAADPARESVLEELRLRLDRQMRATDDPLLKGPIALQPGWKVNRRECRKASSNNPQDYMRPENEGR